MNEKRESKYVRFARLAYAIAQASVPRYAHPKSPQRFTQPQLVVCLLLTQYLNLSYRNTEEWLLASAGGAGTDARSRPQHDLADAQAADPGASGSHAERSPQAA
jgi:hypothetical protein